MPKSKLMREYARSIARFFRDPILALALMEPREYEALAREATDNYCYYGEVRALPAPQLSLYERMVIANART